MKQGISSEAGNASKVLVSEYTTVWSFAQRGAWATHTPDYRGNFAPQVARNIIEMYSHSGDTVLDPMCGGGTTLIECKLLNRPAIGVDINPKAIEHTKQKLNFTFTTISAPDKKSIDNRQSSIAHPPSPIVNRPSSIINPAPVVRTGDVRNLSFLEDASVDLILTHPPYLNIIRYSDGIEGDLSAISSVKKFCDAMQTAAAELYRVLKPGRFCAILMGDTRRGRHFVPLACRVMDRFLKAGFILKEDIIKLQHNCTCTGRWKAKAAKDKFYLIMHEHLFVFRKPLQNEDLSRLRDSLL